MSSNQLINFTMLASQKEDQRWQSGFHRDYHSSKKKNSILSEFFNQKKKSIADEKAIIALSREITTKIWNFITNCEM